MSCGCAQTVTLEPAIVGVARNRPFKVSQSPRCSRCLKLGWIWRPRCGPTFNRKVRRAWPPSNRLLIASRSDLKFTVVLVIGPTFVDGHASLPRRKSLDVKGFLPVGSCGCNDVSRCRSSEWHRAETAQGGSILAASTPEPVLDQRIGLQCADKSITRAHCIS